MAFNVRSKGKIVRRLGVNIYGNAKYDRLLRKKPHGPGQARGVRQRRKISEFGKQLIEKQKLRCAYGLREKQFYNYYLKAKQMKKGLTGDNFLILLERRLDNVVYRIGWGRSRAHARQLINHGHVQLNSRKVNIPSALVNIGDELGLKDNEGSRKVVRESIAAQRSISIPAWVSTSADELLSNVSRYPLRAEIPTVANEQLVVEFYSR